MKSTFTEVNGLKFRFRSWEIERPKAKILLTHGYAEHSGRYDHVGRFFNDHGFSLYAYDMRGHGESEGDRANVKRFTQLVDDLKVVISKVRNKEEQVPWYLMAHSMGGLVTVKYLVENKPSWVKGLLLSAPAMKIQDDISPLLQKMSGVIGAILPWLPTVKLDKTSITKDPEQREKYHSDPLNYRGGTKARYGAESIKTMKSMKKKYNEFDYPILILHGAADRLIDPQGSQLLFDGIASQDRTIRFIPDGYHEILNDPEKYDTMKLITDWVTERL